MGRLWLILDAHNLAYRALHDPRNESDRIEDVQRIVLEGILGDIAFYRRHYQTEHIAVAFDHGRCRRYDMVSDYKGKKDEKLDANEKARKAELRAALELLRTQYLHAIGFRNVLFHRGYEADDVMASVVHRSLDKEDSAVLVSSDKDLYQLLSDRVSIWTPYQRKEVTLQTFWQKYAIQPSAWVLVKAIGGCVSDNVKGVRGVGEDSALRYLRGDGTLKKRYHDLIEANKEAWRANIAVVGLPLTGCQTFVLVPDRVTSKSWTTFCEQHDLGRAAAEAPRKLVPF